MKLSKFFFLFVLLIGLSQCSSIGELQRMAQEDQQIRGQVAKTRGRDTTLIRRMAYDDSLRTDRLEQILNGRSWFDSSSSHSDIRNAFILLNHSYNHNMQRNALPWLRIQAKERIISEVDVATLEDRLLVVDNKPQKYGTQLHVVNDEIVPFPLEDSSIVAQRRAKLGLPPLATYIKMANQFFKNSH